MRDRRVASYTRSYYGKRTEKRATRIRTYDRGCWDWRHATIVSEWTRTGWRVVGKV